MIDNCTNPLITDDTSSAAEPSANALRHGLTAAKWLPRILQPGRLDEIRAELKVEFQPQTMTEELMVQEIARHAAALEVSEQAEPAVLRTAAQGISTFADLSLAAPDDDLLLATAITTEPLDRAARYRRGHEKALHQAIDKLRGLQSTRAAQRPDTTPDAVTEFTMVEDCQAYLQSRFSAGGWRCPRCGGRQGCWLERRKAWECGRCRVQYGLRYGTVFARSALPLTTWFLAIRAFAGCTSITARELMAITRITRPATAQAMLRRIRRAVAGNDVQRGLAGLTAYPLAAGSERRLSAKNTKREINLSLPRQSSQAVILTTVTSTNAIQKVT